MLDQIIIFLRNIQIQDYIIFFISIGFFIIFIFTGIEKIYKAYLGIILGLFIFTMVNLTLKSLNDNDIGVNGLRDFFINHKELFGFYSIFFIPILVILIPLNHNIVFRVSKNKALNYIVTFLFGIFFFSFLLTIFLSIINNRFLFSIDNTITTKIKESYIIKSIFEYFSQSIIFNFLVKYDYIINLSIILFIFYKMTIGGIIDYIINKLLKFLINFFEEKSKSGDNDSHGNNKDYNKHGHGNSHGHDNHDSHGHSSHH